MLISQLDLLSVQLVLVERFCSGKADLSSYEHADADLRREASEAEVLKSEKGLRASERFGISLTLSLLFSN